MIIILVGMARCAVPARVQRAEQTRETMRTTTGAAPLNGAQTAQRVVPTAIAVFKCAAKLDPLPMIRSILRH